MIKTIINIRFENGEVFDKENRKTDYVVKQFWKEMINKGYHEKAICINPVNMWEIFI